MSGAISPLKVNDTAQSDVKSTPPFFDESCLSEEEKDLLRKTMTRVSELISDTFSRYGVIALTDWWSCPDEIKYYLRDLRTEIMVRHKDWPWSDRQELKHGLVYHVGMQAVVKYAEYLEEEKSGMSKQAEEGTSDAKD